MKLSRVVALAATLATMLLAAVAGSASASTGISIDTDNLITATSLGLFTTTSPAGTLSCNVILDIRFTRGLVPYSSPLTAIGSVQSGNTANCRLNTTPVTVNLVGLPSWTIGVTDDLLPTILGASFQIVGSACVFTGDVPFDWTRIPTDLVTTLPATFTGNIAACGNATHAGGAGFGLSQSPTITFLP
ncbi:hypothetical protein [Conexibacter arvalis]|uniref:Protein activator of alkane oxidation PraB n=1 Tax=Conexibacter arvalis TaxID=912552 RepID=A0A840IBA2_9ACTN|nr:hypothetical protein [Conexibacter arvalis]MBB4661220.1 hypothetical protein [Conexibacter arvalis]